MDKMINGFAVLCLICFAILITFGCRDDDDTQDSQASPTVILSSPVSDAEINSNEQFSLTLTIEDNVEISNYRVLIRNRASRELLFVLSEITETKQVTIDTIISLETAEIATMDIEVRAEDDDGNQIDDVVSSFTLNPPVGNSLNLRFRLEYEGAPLVMGSRYTYPTGEEFEFSRFDMYISDLVLVRNGVDTDIVELDYLQMTDSFLDASSSSDGYVYKIAGLEDGEYDSIKFNIGLTPEQNSTTPSDYPVSHPLGLAGDYWPSWDSYIFTSLEGRMNIDTSNPDLEQGIALHLGSDNARREIEMVQDLVLSNNQSEEIAISIDLYDVFVSQEGDIYDIVATPQTHNLIHIPMVIELSDNLKNSIKQ